MLCIVYRDLSFHEIKITDFCFQYISLCIVAFSGWTVVNSLKHHVPHHAVTITPAPYVYSPTPAYHSTPAPVYGHHAPHHPEPAPVYHDPHQGF